MKLPGIAAVLLTAFTCCSVQAGTISFESGSNSIMIEGKIDRGSYQHFIEIIREHKIIPSAIFISSPGGSALDAIEIGRFARRALITVFTNKVCNSSCFFVLVGGVQRFISTPIGLHRPKYEDSYFSGLSAREAKNEYGRLDELVRNYLREMEVPTHLIDKVMTTPSSRVYFINENLLTSEIGQEAPFYNEWLAAKCGTLSSDEERDYLLMIENNLYVSGAREKDSQFDHIKEELDNLSPGYLKYLGESALSISDCRNAAPDNERQEIFQEMLKEK